MEYKKIEMTRSILKKLSAAQEKLDALYNEKQQREKQLKECAQKIKAKKDYLAQYNLTKIDTGKADIPNLVHSSLIGIQNQK